MYVINRRQLSDQLIKKSQIIRESSFGIWNVNVNNIMKF